VGENNGDWDDKDMEWKEVGSDRLKLQARGKMTTRRRKREKSENLLRFRRRKTKW